MEPENHPFEKKRSFSKQLNLDSMLRFGGYTQQKKIGNVDIVPQRNQKNTAVLLALGNSLVINPNPDPNSMYRSAGGHPMETERPLGVCC